MMNNTEMKGHNHNERHHWRNAEFCAQVHELRHRGYTYKQIRDRIDGSPSVTTIIRAARIGQIKKI